ncbi:MAG TPA: PAS domain S-box protein, partial [Gemmatimonadaceae bacterium]|nr:PAS domain S-box protein [Gemmatimonadaceae bacterium]
MTPPAAAEVRSDDSGLPEARFRHLISSVKDYAIFTLFPTGHVETWNAGAQAIKGYSEAEIRGQHFSV